MSPEHDEERNLIDEMDDLAVRASSNDARLHARATAVALRTGRDTREAVDALIKEVTAMPDAICAKLREKPEGAGIIQRALRMLGSREGLAACAVIAPICVALLGRVGCQVPPELRNMSEDEIAATVKVVRMMQVDESDAVAATTSTTTATDVRGKKQ